MLRKLVFVKAVALVFLLTWGEASFASQDVVQDWGVSMKAGTQSTITGDYFYRSLRLSNTEDPSDRWGNEITETLTFSGGSSVSGPFHFFSSDGSSGDATLTGTYSASNG